MGILHYQRKRRPHGNYSLEFIFADVRNQLKDTVQIDARMAPCFSNGLFKRLWITVDAWLRQDRVTHITGDINFAILVVRRRASVLTVLDCGFLKGKTGFRRTLLKTLWLDWPVHHAARVTTISEVVKQEIVELTRCKPEKVIVVHVAISTDFVPSPQTFNEACPRILLVGTAPNKNLQRVANACEGIPCKLIIIGVVPEDLLASLVRANIEFENHLSLSHSQMVDQYKHCDLVCFASTYEGFGMPILEAQAVGRPVITSQISSMPEVAGEAACLVDPFDVSSIRAGLLRVIRDANFRESLLSRGFENVKRFDPREIANKYLDVYRAVDEGLSAVGNVSSDLTSKDPSSRANAIQ